MPKRILALPDSDHVVRHVPWKKLLRDEHDNVIGFLPQAFQLRPDEDALSVTWAEFFDDPPTRVKQAIWEIRRARSVGGKSAFGVGNVDRIKEVCISLGVRVRILHEPKDGEPAHSAIRRLPSDDLTLLAALAEDAFVEIVMSANIPPEGSD